MSPQSKTHSPSPPQSSPDVQSGTDQPSSSTGQRARQFSAPSSSTDTSDDRSRNGQSSDRDTDPNGGNGHRQTQWGNALIEDGEQIYGDLRAIAGSVRHAAGDWQQLLREGLERQPYAVLAIAAGAGYVLGGGLPRGLARALLSLAVGHVIQHGLPSFAADPDSRHANQA
jgi:hypothetical protein